MPAKDKPAVNKHKKARILAKKELQTGTQSKIAREESVSRKTVNQITPERVGPEVLALVGDYKERLIEKAKRNVDEGLDVMHSRMYSGDSKLSEITGAVKISHDILQLQTGQATQINGSPLESDNFKCQRFIDTVLDIEKNGRKPTLEEACEILLGAEMGVDEAIRVRFVEGMRSKRQQIAE
jgi:DNA-binding XRE family transcriptional regulator